MIAPQGRFFSAFAIAAAIAWPSVVLAGTTGVVSGRVYDDNGHLLSGATVWIVRLSDRGEWITEVSLKSHDSFSRITDARGFFVFPSLNPGYYQIEPEMRARVSGCSPKVIVDADQTTYVDLSMFYRETAVDCEGTHYVFPISERLPQQEHKR